MIKAEKYQDYSLDDEVVEVIDDFKEAYSLYHFYRCSYLKNSYQEQKMLEKCKKM